MNFTETKTGLKIYEGLTAEEYASLTKEEHAFYIVEGVGVYKGETLIASATSGGSGGITVIEKTLGGTQEAPTITEGFTEEELDTLISGSGVVRLNMNNVQFVFLTPIFDQQLPEDNVKGVALKGLVSPDNFLYIFVNVVKYGDEEGVTTETFVKSVGGGNGITEEEVNTLINNKISVVVNDDDTIDLTIN